MNENNENVDPMRDAAPDVEPLRLEISEKGEVFYCIDDVKLMMLRRCQQLLFSCFFDHGAPAHWFEKIGIGPLVEGVYLHLFPQKNIDLEIFNRYRSV